jgi:cell wall assembly regulator SMI1
VRNPNNTWKYNVQWAAFLADYEEGMRTWWDNHVDLETGEILAGAAPSGERYIALLDAPSVDSEREAKWALHGERDTLRAFSKQPPALRRRLEDAWFALAEMDRASRQARRAAYWAALEEATGVKESLARHEELARKYAMTRACTELSLEPPPFAEEAYAWWSEVPAEDAAYCNALVERLDSWLRVHAPALHAQLHPGLSADALAHAEAQRGAPFSPGMRALYAWRNGCAQAGFYLNLDFLSLNEAMKEAARMRELARRGHIVFRDAWLPILDKRNGDLLCVDTEGFDGGVPGQLIDYNAHAHGRAPATPLYGDIEAWLESFTFALERGMFTYDGTYLECVDIPRYFESSARFAVRRLRAVSEG